MRTLTLILFASFLFTLTADAQSLPRKVRNVEVQDLDSKKARLPWWGEKNLLIFYVDPEVPKQNHDFVSWIEENKRLEGPNIEGPLFHASGFTNRLQISMMAAPAITMPLLIAVAFSGAV